MTAPVSSLDAHLRNLLQGVDTTPGFDERVMARLQAETHAMAAQRAAQACAEEARRYELARRRQSWGAWIRRAVTLDTVGAAALAGYGLHALWEAAEGRAGDFLSTHGVQAWTAFGLLLALSTLPALLIPRLRRLSVA